MNDLDAVFYLVSTHLNRHQNSKLTAIIQKNITLKGCQVKNNMNLAFDKVYVMPENKSITIE